MSQKLTKRQKETARILFEENLSATDIVRQYHVPARVLQEWLQQPLFQAELDRLRAAALNETRNIIARHGPVAAMKLALLLDSDKPDVARRACLDLIDRCMDHRASSGDAPETEDPNPMTDEQLRETIQDLAASMEIKPKPK